MKNLTMMLLVVAVLCLHLHSEENIKSGLRFNFKDVPLNTILEYFSKSGDFVIIKNIEVEGTVDMYSHREVNREEAIQILSTVLNTKGYGVIRKGEALVIVSQGDAKENAIPVIKGSDPNLVQNDDTLVTQVIPVKYLEVKELVKNLTPLLPSNTSLSANENSNSLILTDTKANVLRILKVITALDTSVVENSKVVVFSLHFAKASGMAEIIEKLFSTESSSKDKKNASGRNGNSGGFMQRMMEMRNGETPKNDDKGSGQVHLNNEQVMVVADETTNSVVVRGSENTLKLIDELISDLDAVSEDKTVIEVLSLRNADPEEMATLINAMFNPAQNKNNTNNLNNFPRTSFGRNFNRNNSDQREGQNNNNEKIISSETITVQADIRTHSIVVSAPSEIIKKIATIVKELDEIPAKKQVVKVYPIKYVDIEHLSEILSSMFSSDSTTKTTLKNQPQNNNSANSEQRLNLSNSNGFQRR